MLPIFDFDDYTHTLDSGQHEAFYFLFVSLDGRTFGFLRTLFGQSTVLEIAALRIDERTWLYQRGHPLAGAPGPIYDASGPTLTLMCLTPWQEWQCYFHNHLTEIASRKAELLKLNLRFHATGPASRYRFGPYQQIQQDGVLAGSLVLAGRQRHGEFLCSRDHSWGQRQLQLADSWLVFSLPARLYLAVINLPRQTAHFGHYFSPTHQREVFQSPNVTAEGDVWRIEDPHATPDGWRVQRVAPPLVVYLGPPGREALRLEPQPGDMYRDEIGPAVYTAPNGRQFLGFLEHARRIA